MLQSSQSDSWTPTQYHPLESFALSNPATAGWSKLLRSDVRVVSAGDGMFWHCRCVGHWNMWYMASVQLFCSCGSYEFVWYSVGVFSISYPVLWHPEISTDLTWSNWTKIANSWKGNYLHVWIWDVCFLEWKMERLWWPPWVIVSLPLGSHRVKRDHWGAVRGVRVCCSGRRCGRGKRMRW